MMKFALKILEIRYINGKVSCLLKSSEIVLEIFNKMLPDYNTLASNLSN